MGHRVEENIPGVFSLLVEFSQTPWSNIWSGKRDSHLASYLVLPVANRTNDQQAGSGNCAGSTEDEFPAKRRPNLPHSSVNSLLTKSATAVSNDGIFLDYDIR